MNEHVSKIPTVGRVDLEQAVAERLGLSHESVVAPVVQLFLTGLAEALAAGSKVQMRRFGAFEARDRASRTCVNPHTGETVQVPAKKAVFFRAGSALNALVQPSEEVR